MGDFTHSEAELPIIPKAKRNYPSPLLLWSKNDGVQGVERVLVVRGSGYQVAVNKTPLRSLRPLLNCSSEAKSLLINFSYFSLFLLLFLEKKL